MLTQSCIYPSSFSKIISLPVTQQVGCPYGDENQLAAEMANHLQMHTQDQLQPDIDPEDFEKLYQWFLS